MDYGAIALALGTIFTVMHVICDLGNLRLHWRHRRDWLTAIGAPALIGHIILTGELSGWLRWAGIL